MQLRRFLRGCEVAAFSADQAHEVGSLLAKAEMSDVVDAHVTLTAAQRGSAVLTSDYSDITRLASHLPTPIQVQPIASLFHVIQKNRDAPCRSLEGAITSSLTIVGG